MALVETWWEATLETLRNSFSQTPQDRSGAWQKALAHVPPTSSLHSAVRAHLRLLKAYGVTAPPRRRPRRRRPPPRASEPRPCACGQHVRHPPPRADMPPEHRAIWARHIRQMHQRRASHIRWKDHTPQQARDATARARTALRRKREDRWLATLDPRLVQTLGREQAVAQYVRAYNARTTNPRHHLKLPEDTPSCQ